MTGTQPVGGKGVESARAGLQPKWEAARSGSIPSVSRSAAPVSRLGVGLGIARRRRRQSGSAERALALRYLAEEDVAN